MNVGPIESRMDWVWLDGEVIPGSQASVPIYDRGFLYGDAVFETMRSYGGILHELDAHLARLDHSQGVVAMEPQFSSAFLKSAFSKSAPLRFAPLKFALIRFAS